MDGDISQRIKTEPPTSLAGDRQEVFSAEDRTVTPIINNNLLSVSGQTNTNNSESFSNSSMNVQKRLSMNAENQKQSQFQHSKSK